MSKLDFIGRVSPMRLLRASRKLPSSAGFFPAPGKALWASGSARDAALERLALNRIAELPRLIDVMAHLIEPDVESIGAATWRLRQTRGLTQTAPAFARINDRLEHA